MARWDPTTSGKHDPCKVCGSASLLGWKYCEPCLKAIQSKCHKLDLSGKQPRCSVCGIIITDRNLKEQCSGPIY